MNKKQIKVMWVGIAVFILFLMFTETSWCNWSKRKRQFISSTDYKPLAIRLVSTVLISAGLIVTLRDKKK